MKELSSTVFNTIPMMFVKFPVDIYRSEQNGIHSLASEKSLTFNFGYKQVNWENKIMRPYRRQQNWCTKDVVEHKCFKNHHNELKKVIIIL